MATDRILEADSLTVDLTGLPASVVEQVHRLVTDARAEQAAAGNASTGRQPLLGRFAHLGFTFPKEELDEAQRELWSAFPREFPTPDVK